ncbi:hypothetical protein [Amycolatopsis tolypomycina]|uniref:hypothetical protein n=1 Tax=Amycolatopsis tolypomycina TaxID=208445 RepID=UPI0033BB11AD
MSEQSDRRPARYYEDQFRFSPSGRRLTELTDTELVILDPSRIAQLAPPPLPPDEPRDGEQPQPSP